MSTIKTSRIGTAPAIGLGLLLACGAPWAAGIYTCTDASGKRLTSDRPIVDCIDREQRVLNADGSVKQTISRTLTAEERAEKEARDREAASQNLTRQDAVRRDRNLMTRFPNAAAHQKAREAALNDVRNAMKTSDARLALLATERKPLMDESEFYVGKPLPAKLKRQLDANDASTEAQRTLIQDQRAELQRISALYDAELERLKLLWGGAPPGSIGAPVASTAASAPARKSAAK
ncbi:MAG: hypothetical protein AD742_06700 [Methylibium sp. NZG]|nr:MAG: hypothetical protein AD742_06700 [Methylibium sp. NZG]